MLKKVLCLCGMIAPLWLLVGVTITGYLYPDYSHTHQAMSELHALGSPVQHISPFINNYPLGLLFMGFGLFIILQFNGIWSRLSGVFILLHGVGSMIAGAFPCDVGCDPTSTLQSQEIHGLGAMIMSLSFLIAPLLWVFIAKKNFGYVWLSWLSAAAIVGQIALFPAMANALEVDRYFGILQRIAYAIPLIWLLVLSSVSFRKLS